MSTLYRKYRPQNFNEVVGQNHIKITLSHEIEAGKIAHAYIFCGPRAVGKTTLARVFAKSINCLKRKEGAHEACGKCDNCLEISENKSLDILEIDAASHTGVDNVRENIINASRITPTKSKYKVFIIDEVHMLSISAFNALLKILEEPPKHVIFILCTTEIHKVPSTIISRCQRFDFKKIGITDIVSKLSYIAQKEELDVDKKVLEAVARKSEGHMRDAESIFGQILSISGSKKISKEDAELIVPSSTFEEAISLVEYLASKDIAKSITLVNKILDDGINLNNFQNDLIEILRKVMFVKVNPALDKKIGTELGESLENRISKIVKSIELDRIIYAIETFQEAKQKTKNSFIVQLPTETAIIKICSKQDTQKVAPQATVNTKQPGVVQDAPSISQVQPGKTAEKKESGAILTLEDIHSRWNEVLTQVKRVNHSLLFVLQASRPKEIIDSKLRLVTKYKFHKDRIETMDIKILIEKVLHNVFGKVMTVEALVDENMETNVPKNYEKQETLPTDDFIVKEKPKEKGDNNNMMNNLLKTFGGKVVNN